MYHLVPQVFVAQTNYHPRYGHYITVWEADGNVEVCLETNGMITDPLYIDIETNDQHVNTTLRSPATGKSNILGGRRWCPDDAHLYF